MSKNIKRHIKAALLVIGLFASPFLLAFLTICLGTPFIQFVIIATLIFVIVILYKTFLMD